MSESDREYVQRCLDGNADAFRHLVKRYQGPLLSYLTGRVGDEEAAAEAAQESFVRAYFALRKLKKPESFFSWVLGIAGRVAKETYRAQKREQKIDMRDREAPKDPGNDPADAHVRDAVAELPEPYRQVVLLRYYAGLSCAEIARELSAPLGTVTKRLSRAYALLRESLRKQDQEKDVEVQR